MADSPFAPEPPTGDSGPNQQGPNCDAIDLGFATQPEFFVYRRRNLCGEVWSFPERRLVRRAQAGGNVTDVPSSTTQSRCRAEIPVI